MTTSDGKDGQEKGGEARTTGGDARRLLSTALDFLKVAGASTQDTLKRTYEVTTLKLDITRLKRSLDDVSRDLGRQALKSLRQEGQLGAESVATILRRADEIEDRIASQERLLADLEREERTGTTPGGSSVGGGKDTEP